MNNEYTRKRDNILTLLQLSGIDKNFVDAVKDAMDMSYEMGHEDGWAAGFAGATGEE